MQTTKIPIKKIQITNSMDNQKKKDLVHLYSCHYNICPRCTKIIKQYKLDIS